jgi:integral membrane protein (TIGR00529 family)
LDIIKLLLIFACITIVMKFNKPLSVSIAAGIGAAIVLYGINPLDTIKLVVNGTFSKGTFDLIMAFYSITFLQRMLEKRGHIVLAERSLNNLFNNRRINTMIAPFIIGLLPSAGAVLIAAPIVDNAVENYLTKEEKTFVTSYYRHISESFLPTYSSILLALSLSGVDMTSFVWIMLPMVVVLFLLGYFFYIRKIPKDTGVTVSSKKIHEIKNIVISLWSIALSIIIILAFKITVHLAVIPVIVLYFILNKFTFDEIKPMFRSAFEVKLILSTVIIMIFKEVLDFTGIIQRLPGYLSLLPIPSVVIFAMVAFLGALVAGSQGSIALAVPLAYATIPDGGVALMVLLMCMIYIAMQVSPMHICLAIITEHYGTPFIELVKKTMPIVISFVIISSIYSYFMFLIM